MRNKEIMARKVFKFGKIDYNGTGRKVNPVEVEVELRNTDKGPEFTACGEIWNHIHTDCYCAGQCLDTIAETAVGYNPTFKEIYRLWKLYHLNGLHAGTAEQEEAVDSYFEREGRRYDYMEACNHLKFCGLYTVPHPETGEPYVYGHGWLYKAIPDEDMEIIKRLLEVA